jgi:hypothetical protein
MRLHKLKKSWPPHKLDEALAIMKKNASKRHPALKFLDILLDYSILLSGAALIIGLSLLLFPLLLVANGYFLYLTMGIGAIAFGTLYAALAHGLFFLEQKKHIYPVALVPIIGFTSMKLIADYSNSLIIKTQMNTSPHPSIILGLCYVLFFMAPFIIYHFYQKSHQ